VLRELEDPNVWSDPEKARVLGKERAQLAAVVETLEQLDAGLHDAAELVELAREDDDDSLFGSVVDDVQKFARQIEALEFRRMFSGTHDANNAFLDIQAGSGGTAELIAWLVVLAFTRGPADVLDYMAAHAWRSGTAMVIWPNLAA